MIHAFSSDFRIQVDFDPAGTKAHSAALLTSDPKSPAPPLWLARPHAARFSAWQVQGTGLPYGVRPEG